MVRLRFAVELEYQVQAPGADFIFNLQAAQTRHQRIIDERLELSQPVRTTTHTTSSRTRARCACMPRQAPCACCRRPPSTSTHRRVLPQALAEVRIDDLPPQVLRYLYPSRYCESDKLHAFAVQQFGRLWQGYGRVSAIRDWVTREVAFRPNTSSSLTTACDTLASKQGVCRDFAHLMIALCRAVNIPARFATGFDYGADPALGPPDFHAYVEVWLSGGWFLFDPSGVAIPMGFVRLATSRDAADAAFATIFGGVVSQAPRVHIEAVADDHGLLELPQHCTDALSTDAGDD